LNAIADPNLFAGALASGRLQGSVTFVGAGPGDPDLLTVKALRILQDADLVVHDQAVSPEILDRIRRDASRIVVGTSKDDANRQMIEAAQSGQRVVRLAGGDGLAPGLSEELAALRESGITCLVVPGVTAEFADARTFPPPARSRGSRAGAAKTLTS